MTRVIAAIDNSAAARPVLSTGIVIARLFDAELEAIHVREDGVRAAEEAAGAAGVRFRAIRAPIVAGIVAATEAVDVVAVVLGARATPGGRRPVGRAAHEVITTLGKPVAIVPPDARARPVLHRLLVPLNGTAVPPSALGDAIERACDAGLEVVVLHVHEEASLPLFSDQPQHEMELVAREFLARFCPHADVAVEFRVGVPGHQVLHVATERRIDLIVLGWGQNLSAGRAAVVREVLERSAIPVMLLPAPPLGAERATVVHVPDVEPTRHPAGA